MANSMTGYGKGNIDRGDWSIVVEAKSVNHRFLESVIRIPRSYLYLEDFTRRKFQEAFSRGRIEVFVTIQGVSQSTKKLQVNRELLQQMKDYIMEERALLADEGIQLSYDRILLHPEVVSVEEKEDVHPEFESSFEAALAQCIVQLKGMREREGKHLVDALCEYLRECQSIHTEMKQHIGEDTKAFFQKIKKRMEELELQLVDSDRIAAEAAIFSEKVDISEEMTRLSSHFEQFAQIIKEESVIGRKLDFVIQEMNREVNTISSKTASISIKKQAIQLKVLLEKMREQVQNLE